VDYILSSLKEESEQLKLSNSILLKSEEDRQLHDRISQIRLQEEISRQDAAQASALALQTLETRQANLLTQEISAQNQQKDLQEAQESLKTAQNALLQLETERLTQIDLDLGQR
jgi:hypothetical protein